MVACCQCVVQDTVYIPYIPIWIEMGLRLQEAMHENWRQCMAAFACPGLTTVGWNESGGMNLGGLSQSASRL